MRALLAPLAAVLLAALALGCGRTAPPARPQPSAGAPNVLLVSIDTLRADRVGAYGATYGATPTIDALAADGARVETAIAAAPLTLPSHATLLTGLYPPRHGVRHNGIFRLGDEQVTLAERFRDAGYATGAAVGAFVLDHRFGLAQGFDVYDDAMGAHRASATGYPERRASEVTDAALRWLAGVDRPFFLFVHYYDPHAAYQPPPPFDTRFAGRPYEGEIASVDAALARLLDALRASGRFESTIVVVTADHGESLGEHGERTHAYTLYDATLAVPLVLRGPGVPRGRTVAGVLSTASIAPTLLHLAGLAPLDRPDGVDFVARMQPGAPGGEGDEAYAETLATRLDHGWAPLHALRTATRHYVRAPRPELYDVARDPGERSNLLAGGERSKPLAGGERSKPLAGGERSKPLAGGERSNRLAAGSHPEAKTMDDAIAERLAHGLPLRRIALDDATRAQLEQLGYAVRGDTPDENRMDPKDGLPLVETAFEARAALNAGDAATAEAKAHALLAKSPDSPQAHILLEEVARERGDAPGALREGEAALRLLPESASLALDVADLRLETGDLARAAAGYEAALAIDAKLAPAQAGLMWRAVAANDAAAAAAAADAAVALDPDDAGVRLRIARAFDRLGDAERALAAFDAALRLDPDAHEAEMGSAIQLVRLGRSDEAEQRVAAAGELAKDPNLRNRMAIAYAARGDTPRAEALFRDVLAAHPEHAGTRRNLAHLLRTTGRGAEADRLEAEAPKAG